MIELSWPAAAGSSGQSARSVRLRGLGLVLLVALAYRLVAALEWRYGAPAPSPGIDHDPALGSLAGLVRGLSLLGLLAYVLFREGRGIRQLGVTARWSDLSLGAALAVLRLLPYAAEDLVRRGTLGDWVVSRLSLERVSLVELADLLASAAMIELVFRAYLMTEALARTGNAAIAVTASVGLELLYDFEVRAATVVGLVICSLFYWRTGRATPLVVGRVGASLWVWLHAAGG